MENPPYLASQPPHLASHGQLLERTPSSKTVREKETLRGPPTHREDGRNIGENAPPTRGSCGMEIANMVTLTLCIALETSILFWSALHMRCGG